MGDGLLTGEWIAGPALTMADICLFSYLEDLRDKGQSMPEGCDRLTAWFDRISARPAAEMSLWKWRSVEQR